MYNVEFFYANMGYPYPTDFRYLPQKKFWNLQKIPELIFIVSYSAKN